MWRPCVGDSSPYRLRGPDPRSLMRRDALWLSAAASPAAVSSEAWGSGAAGDASRVDAALLGLWRGAADGERRRI